MLSLWVISQSLLHFDKIHKNNTSILIIPTLSSNPIFVDIIAYFRSWRKENSSRIPAHGIYWSGKLFLQPIELREISMTNSWNYFMTKSLRKICARPGSNSRPLDYTFNAQPTALPAPGTGTCCYSAVHLLSVFWNAMRLSGRIKVQSSMGGIWW